MTGTNLPRVPEGLRDLMKGFTKDVLREKPENLYEYSANYFDGIVSEKIPQPLRKYEPAQNYEAILKNRIRQQVPLSLVFNIIPETLTDLIKQFIKAVLKENPENIYIFAKEYFHQLSISKTTQNKTTKYSSYEKYLESKENVRYTTKVTCECGRVLSATNQPNAKPNALIIEKDNGKQIHHNANYIRAVCIIQRNVRKYLKRKKAKKNYNSHEYINAIYIIQRQFRRYLTKKRMAKSKYVEKQSSKNLNQHYDSVTYMQAVYVIQRHYRLYRKRQEKQKKLKNNGVSLSAAAFIIQRTFRRLIRARRAKKHIPAALDQGDDDVNDNASEAGSYTSASTALLSTESAGEHIEFGGNYDESVHQQTINEDEEVENNYVNFDEKHFEEPIKNEGQSINTKMWDASIEYTGNEEEIIKDNINRENKKIGEEFVQSDMEPDKKISSEIGTKTKRILSGKDEHDLKSLQVHKLPNNDLDTTTIVTINNLNNQLSNEERTETKTDMEVQKTKDPKKSKIASQVESFLDDAKKAITETLHLESSQKSGDNNKIDELNGVEIEKEIVEPIILKTDTKANESAIVKTINEDKKQETEAKETAGKIVNKIEITENNDEKEKEIDKTIVNLAEESENNNNQLTTEKIANKDKKNGIEVETIVKETFNEVESLKINDDQEKEVNKTIGNKTEQTENNNNQLEIGESHKNDNTGELAVEETMKSVEKSESINENEKIVEAIEEKKKITKREINSAKSINDAEETETEEPVTPKMESERIENTDVQPKTIETEIGVKEPKDISETSTKKTEIEVHAPTNEKMENEVKEVPKVENLDDLMETTNVQPEIVEIEDEVNKQIIDEKDLNEATNTKIKIEIDGPSDDNVNNEIEDENILKFENEDDIVETGEVQMESEKTETEIDVPTTVDVEKQIEDLKDEIVKEQNETTKVELENEMIESTEVKTENEIDESNAAKMEIIVEEAILAKMAINKMSHKNENIQGDEISNIEYEGNEPLTAEMEMKVKETPIAIAGNANDDESTDIKVEIKVAPEESSKLELVNEIVEQTNEKLENEPKEVTAIVKENERINGSEDKTVPPIQEEKKTICEKEIISDDPNIIKKGNKSAELMPIEKKKIEDIKTTIVNVENNLRESAQQNEQVTQNIEKIVREENEADILKMQKEVDEPAIKIDSLDDAVTATEEVKGPEGKLIFTEPERTSNESVKEKDSAEEKEQAKPLIDEAIDIGEKQTNKSKESTFTKEDDPTKELVADLINKMHIKETQNEMAEPGTKIIENDDANEPINKKITKEINEPEVVKLDDKKDQQTLPKIESEDDKVVKKDEIQKDEPILNVNVNEPTNELIIKKIEHKNDISSVDKLENNHKEQTSKDDEPSVEKLEGSTKKQTTEDEESKVLKIENEINDNNRNKTENEVKEIFGINNEPNSDARTTDSKPQSEDPQISSELATERMTEIVEEDSHVIDKRNTDIANSSAESQEAQTVDKPLDKLVAADTKHELKDSSLLKSNKLIGTQNFTNTSTNEIDNNTKKLPKDKHIGSSLESGRLIPTPIAELQLKSFKIPADSAPWYEPVDEYKITNEEEPKKENNVKVQADSKISEEDELKKGTNAKLQAEYKISEKDEPKKERVLAECHISDDDNSKNENNVKDLIDVIKPNNGNVTEEIFEQNRPSSSALERVPKYFTGDETTPIKDPQVKNSISFFISFDSDDEKTTFKVPKKFLRNSKEGDSKTSETKTIEDDKDEQIEEESYPDMEDELEIEIEENDFQQFAASKLQTIPEVNESDSSNDLRYGSLTAEQDIEKPLREVSNPSTGDLAQEVKEVIESDSTNDLRIESLTVEQDIEKTLAKEMEMVSNPNSKDLAEEVNESDSSNDLRYGSLTAEQDIKNPLKEVMEMVSNPSTGDLAQEVKEVIESDSTNDLRIGSLTVEQDIEKTLAKEIEMVSNPNSKDLAEEVNESDSSNDLRYGSLTVEQDIEKTLAKEMEMVSNANTGDLAQEVNESDSTNDLRYGSITVEQDIKKTLTEGTEMVSNPNSEDLAQEITESTQSDIEINKDFLDTIKTDNLITNDNEKDNDKESSSEAIEMVQPSTKDLSKEIKDEIKEATLSVDVIEKDGNKNDNDEKHNAAVIIQNCVRAFLRKRTANRSEGISNDAVSQFSQQIAAKKIQRAYREYIKRNDKEKPEETSLPEQSKVQSARIKDKLGTEMMAALIIQRAYRSYCERKKRETYEDSTQGSITSSPMTAIRNLSISSELTSLESTSVQDVVLPSSEDCQSNKDIDSLDGGTTPPIGVAVANIDAGIDTETIATARNAESTNDTPVDREHGLLESKFVPDTSNSLIDQNQIRSLEQDNAVSNDLAISTDDAMFGLVEDLTKAPFAHLASSSKETTAIREIVNEFLINEIQYSARDLNLSEVQEEPCIRKTASVTSLCEGLDGSKTLQTGNITSESKENESSVIERQLTQGESIDVDGNKTPNTPNASKQNESFESDVIQRQLTRGESLELNGNKTPQTGDSKRNDSSDGDVIERHLTREESIDLNGNKSPNASKENESSEADVIERQLSSAESIDLDTFATDTLDKATLKLSMPEKTIEKMSQRQVSESLDKGNLPTEASFEEPIIKSMGSLQEQTNTDIEDGDLIIYNRLQREDTRESSAQSDSVVFGDPSNEESTENINKIDGENTRVQFTRHYTIAGDDPRRMFKSVTIDDTVRYVEDGENDYDAAPLLDATNSFCLDDETSETIRKKIMAYSFSETDSDYFDPNKVITDDSFIDTAMADEMGTSTETESTIVSAATKIQAGARGFLTRRRLRRASAGTKSSTQDTKASFGNDAISESLERFIEEEAAKKIQSAYRFHVRKQKRLKNKLEMSSLESSLAARRQKLQRGDALRNDSTPDDDNSARTSITTTTSNGTQNERLSKKYRSETAATAQRKTKTSMEFKWPVLRQNSMPVQIDCEVLRVIPKHMRKRIKSAESQKKKRK